MYSSTVQTNWCQAYDKCCASKLVRRTSRVSKCTPRAIFKRVKRRTSLIVGLSVDGTIPCFTNKFIITVKDIYVTINTVHFREPWHQKDAALSFRCSNFIIFVFCFADLHSRGGLQIDWKFESPWIQQDGHSYNMSSMGYFKAVDKIAP